MKTFEDYSIEELERFKAFYIIIMIVIAIIAFITTWAFLLIDLFLLIPIGNCNRCINEKKQKEIERKEAEHRAERQPREKAIANAQIENSANSFMPIPVVKKFRTDKSEAIRRLRQLTESYDLVQTTLKADVFFGRLSFCFDCVLDLMTYKDGVFRDSTPEDEFNRLSGKLEELVNDFIVRSYNSEYKKAIQLKTDKGRQNRIEKYFINMESAFRSAHSFWTGNSGSPHYTGPLYTENNLTKLRELETKNLQDMVSAGQ